MNVKKQFGVWMDTQHATIVGQEQVEHGPLVVIAHVKREAVQANSNENAANNNEITLVHKFFKEIASHMPNVDVLHITGTGQIQEQFAHYLSNTPQYKNTQTSESTANKMSDDALLEYFVKVMK
jgi:hypothetical protein